MVTPVSLALLFNVICLAKSMRTIRHLQQVGDITAVTYLLVGFLLFSKRDRYNTEMTYLKMNMQNSALYNAFLKKTNYPICQLYPEGHLTAFIN